MENIAFVLGNGTNRLVLDLDQLKKVGTVYGCNALYREFTPDVLVSTDPGISEEIQNSRYSLTNLHYTRKPLPGKGSRKIEHNYGFSSGPIALTYAALSQATTIYFAGFDLIGLGEKFNNVYADTAHYKTSNDKATFHGNWVKQIAQIIEKYTNKNFIRLVNDGAYTPVEWAGSNYSESLYNDFLVMINNINPK